MAEASPISLQVATLAFGAFSTALLGHLFGWRKSKAETESTLQKIVDERLKTLLASDEIRLKQMSEALEGQSRIITGLQQTIADQSDRVGQLEAVVKSLSRHIVNLERMLRQRNIDPPPRPQHIHLVDGKHPPAG